MSLLLQIDVPNSVGCCSFHAMATRLLSRMEDWCAAEELSSCQYVAHVKNSLQAAAQLN